MNSYNTFYMNICRFLHYWITFVCVCVESCVYVCVFDVILIFLDSLSLCCDPPASAFWVARTRGIHYHTLFFQTVSHYVVHTASDSLSSCLGISESWDNIGTCHCPIFQSGPGIEPWPPMWPQPAKLKCPVYITASRSLFVFHEVLVF